jgi:hypothetical protein
VFTLAAICYYYCMVLKVDFFDCYNIYDIYVGDPPTPFSTLTFSQVECLRGLTFPFAGELLPLLLAFM